MKPVVDRRPRPARAMPYMLSAASPLNSRVLAKMVAPMAIALHTEDSRPWAKPVRMSVAGPVLADITMSWTGRPSAPVKWSVSFSITNARMMPMKVARKNRHHSNTVPSDATMPCMNM